MRTGVWACSGGGTGRRAYVGEDGLNHVKIGDLGALFKREDMNVRCSEKAIVYIRGKPGVGAIR